jgi:Leucine-rich repeat (LRR) protein
MKGRVSKRRTRSKRIQERIRETREGGLKRLALSNEFLSSLPAEVFELVQLESLDLQGNQLTQVPEAITRLQNLTYLILSDNQLTQVPEAITRLQNLTRLYLEGNPIELPPPDVADKGIDAIRDYFRQLHSEGEGYIYEAKLLIVGEAGQARLPWQTRLKTLSMSFEVSRTATLPEALMSSVGNLICRLMSPATTK